MSGGSIRIAGIPVSGVPPELAAQYDYYAKSLREHSLVDPSLAYGIGWLMKIINNLARDNGAFVNYMMRNHFDVAAKSYDGRPSILELGIAHKGVMSYLRKAGKEDLIGPPYNDTKIRSSAH